MNKKIRAVVKHYEKNMKFESKFEQLSHKLDLIKDDTPLKSDVIVIRRKLIPAYMMSILVMALVTGLIGLQIGLGNLKVKTEYVNPISIALSEELDVYIPYAIDSVVLDDTLLTYYFGLSGNEMFLMINIHSKRVFGEVTVYSNNATYSVDLTTDVVWILIPVDENLEVNMNISLTDGYDLNIAKNKSIDLTEYLTYIYGDSN